MRGRIGLLAMVFGLASVVAMAQETPKTPAESDIYCSGMVTTDPVPSSMFIITGEQSNYKATFAQGDYVYINKGSSQGAKVGDQFLVTRAVGDHIRYPWFTGQLGLERAMGTQWADLGRLQIVAVRADVSIAQVSTSCDNIQRGDYVLPFADRPAPPEKSEANFDRFAPPSGHAQAMVVTSKDFRVQLGAGEIAYVNLGSKQGVKVGDYFRLFRYQGSEREIAYQTANMATSVYGFGHSPQHYRYDQLPREILGEGIVLRVTPNASTVLITLSLREIMLGAYAELE